MDNNALADLLNSCLPFLMGMGVKATDSVSKKFGEDVVWETAKKIWERLRPELEAKDDARIAAEQVAAKPDSKARKDVFQEELETLLKENPDLAEEIAEILAERTLDGTSRLQIIQTITGNQNQVIGQVTGGKVFGSVTGNVTISE